MSVYIYNIHIICSVSVCVHTYYAYKYMHIVRLFFFLQMVTYWFLPLCWFNVK